jgi:hypothetical protein
VTGGRLLPLPNEKDRIMQVKTNLKAGDRGMLNHNEVRVRTATRGLKIRTGVKAGGVVRTPIGSGGSPG